MILVIFGPIPAVLTDGAPHFERAPQPPEPASPVEPASASELAAVGEFAALAEHTTLAERGGMPVRSHRRIGGVYLRGVQARTFGPAAIDTPHDLTAPLGVIGACQSVAGAAQRAKKPDGRLTERGVLGNS